MLHHACMYVYVFERVCVCVCALTLAFLHVCLANYALRTNKSGSLAARCSGTLFGAADDDAAALWELRLSRLPGCLFFNAPPSLYPTLLLSPSLSLRVVCCFLLILFFAPSRK